MLITRDDIQRVGDEATLMHFLKEKLNLPIPEKASLAQIALPLPLPFLGLDDTIAEEIIDCQDFSGLSQDALADRRPFLIRFRREQDYPGILRKVAEGLSQKNINPDEILFICANEYFRPFAFAYFNDSEPGNWNAAVLNIFAWTQDNTYMHTSYEHRLPTVFDENYVEAEPEIDEAQLRRNRYLAKPVSELELSVRASNCLETANIKTIRELVTKEEKDMLEYKNFGRTSLNEIKEQLANMGLTLGMDLNDMDDRDISEEDTAHAPLQPPL